MVQMFAWKCYLNSANGYLKIRDRLLNLFLQKWKIIDGNGSDTNADLTIPI